MIFVVCGGVLSLSAALQGDSSNAALVVVNGEPITSGDLELEYLSRRVPEELREQVREHLLEQLIDRRLMGLHLAGRKAEAAPAELDAQVTFLRRVIEQGQGDYAKTLARLGFTEETLRQQLALPLAWKTYIRRIVTDEQVRDCFTRRRGAFDGTQVRASQIVLIVNEAADASAWDSAERTLNDLRAEIVAGKLAFADAARQHSASPSGKQGGDLGFFPFRGRVPGAIAAVAFRLEAGQVSQPFRSPFGVHLVTVTDRKPGDLSLEDVRGQVLDALSQELWDEQVRQQRAEATIEWKIQRRAITPKSE